MSCKRLQQADAAHVDALAAHRQVVSARIRVACGNGGHHLRKRYFELQQFASIDFGNVLPRASAESGHVDDSGNLLDFARHEPVLRGLQFIQGVTGPYKR